MMGEAGQASANLAITRIFIGGLSTSVTATELEKMFSSLGRIRSTEFVRSDGRSFAFVDFEPNSDKTLAKLFATYNGCTWKGGKLRLEKAKEHYLARLKRDWVENESINTSVTPHPEKSPNISRIPGYLNPENTHLRIFFPKLRKVKAVPFKGTGKHKYSFQHIEVPSLPVHFCDCEEHSEPIETVEEKYLSALHSAASEKERTIASNVLSKLLQKEFEEAEVLASRRINFLNDSKVTANSDKIVEVKEIEEEASEADNLITNIGSTQSDEVVIQRIIGKKMDSEDKIQKPRISKLKPLEHEVSRIKARSKKRQKTAPSLAHEVALPKEVSSISEVILTEDESTTKPMRKAFSNKIEERENHVVGSSEISQTNCTTDAAKPEIANTWIQKYSWRELVGDSVNSSFSISNVLPNMNSEPKKLQKGNKPDTAPSTAKSNPVDTIHMLSSIQKKSQSEEQGSKPLQMEQKIQIQKDLASKDEMEKSVTIKGEEGYLNSRQEEQPRIVPKVAIGQVCTFMRTAESLKQWSKLKATLAKKKGKRPEDPKEPEDKPHRGRRGAKFSGRQPA